MTLTENSAALASPFPSSFETRTLYKGNMLIYQLKRNWITMSVIKQEKRVIREKQYLAAVRKPRKTINSQAMILRLQQCRFNLGHF